MKNTLYHYGDSFGTWYNSNRPNETSRIGFSQIISDHLNLNFVHRAVGGFSNNQISTRIIEDLFKFKKGDVIIVNWSFFHRFPIMLRPFNKGNIVTMSENITTRGGNNIQNLPEPYLKYNVLHRMDFQEEEWNLLFWGVIKPIFEGIRNLGVKTYVSFNNTVLRDTTHNNPHKKFLHDTNLMNVLTYDYIGLMNFHNLLKEGEDVHYRFGTQNEISKLWVDYIESLP